MTATSASRPSAEKVSCFVCSAPLGPRDWTGLCRSHRQSSHYHLATPRPSCIFAGCQNLLTRANRSGLCRAAHMPRFNAWRHRHPGGRLSDYLEMFSRTCSEPGCGTEISQYVRGDLCKNHARTMLRKSDPERFRGERADRRARQRDAFVEHVDRDVLFERDAGVCHLCRMIVDPGSWDADHVTPLVAGGLHCYANMAVSHPGCNRSKGARERADRRIDSAVETPAAG